MHQEICTINKKFIYLNDFDDEGEDDIFVKKRYEQVVREIGQQEALLVRRVRTYEISQYYQCLSPNYKLKTLKKHFNDIFCIDYSYISDEDAKEIFLKQAADTIALGKSKIEDAVKSISLNYAEEEIQKRLGLNPQDLMSIEETYKPEVIEITEEEYQKLEINQNFEIDLDFLKCKKCGNKI